MMTIAKDWKRDYLYRMFSHHTRNKEKENYILNSIWARIDDLRVKPVTQQYVRRPNGYALIDLYFPQINFGVECDEAYHQDNTFKDAERELDLIKALSACDGSGLAIRRIDATQSVEDLHHRICEIAYEVRQHIAEKGEEFLPWLSPDEEWAYILKRGELRVGDAYAFKTIADICVKCFGRPEGYKIQRCFIQIGNGKMLWCPKLAIKLPDGQLAAQSRGWINELSIDWKTITERNVSESNSSNGSKHIDRPRITFAKSKDERGEDAYRFIGVFKWCGKTGENCQVYKRIATNVSLF